MEMDRLASVDPPAAAFVGVGSNRAPEALGQDGGVPGFPLDDGSAWSTTLGDPAYMNDLTDFLEEIEANPNKKAAAHLRALDRLRLQLTRIPEGSELDTPVAIPLHDAALLARWLLGRLR